MGTYSYVADQYFSVDHFLHARACVVANGQEAYEKVLHTPGAMFKDLTFEPLLSVASTAYTRQTAQQFVYILRNIQRRIVIKQAGKLRRMAKGKKSLIVTR